MMKTKQRYVFVISFLIFLIYFNLRSPQIQTFKLVKRFVKHEFNGYSIFEKENMTDDNNNIIWIDKVERGFSPTICAPKEPRKFPHESGRFFRPEELDLSNYEGQDPLIPAIIHQQWNTYSIPAASKPLIQSIIEKHPNWEYWLWTEQDRNCYVKTFHPELWELWNSYSQVITRADAMRYIILHDIGGFYLDLDIKCLQPLDAWRYVAPCFLLHNGYETVFHFFNETIGKGALSTMACRPRHPFLKKLLEVDRLKCFHNVFRKTDATKVAGSYYMNSLYFEYLRENIDKVSFMDDIQVVHPR